MRKVSSFIVLAPALTALVLFACKTPNTAPDVPTISGPGLAKPGQPLTFAVSTSDPQNDDVSYFVAWGDGATEDWGAAHPSGEQVGLVHTYADSGRYFVKAMARDAKGLETAWSDSVMVGVGFRAPNTPFQPVGPVSCTTGVAYGYSFRAVHPLGDSVQFQVWWGDALADWGPLTASGTFYRAEHQFETLGTYRIAARARDAHGLESSWSESLRVTVNRGGSVPGGSPRNFTLTAASDTTVLASWTAPESLVPVKYTIAFRRFGYGGFEVIGETTGTSLVHDPQRHTGDYQVTAVYDSVQVTSPTVRTTIPVETRSVSVYELNAPGFSGYGWDRASFGGTLRDMTLGDSAYQVDFYISDFATGFAGPDYSIASPVLGPTDPGGGVPAGNWNATWFSGPLETDTVPLPAYSTQRYAATRVMTPIPCMFAVYTQDGYYALATCTGVDVNFGTAAIESWFQPVRGLRLIEH